MVGYVTLIFMMLATASFFLAPATYSKLFCVWEMLTFVVAAIFFLRHKIGRNGVICFDTFFIPTFFLINYAHAVFIYPDDQFLPAFLFATNTDIIPYALAVAQMGISFYMVGNVFFEREVPEQRQLQVDIPEMAVNRMAWVAFAASAGVFGYVIVFHLASGFEHLFPRLMAMIVALIALSWFFQAQRREDGDQESPTTEVGGLTKDCLIKMVRQNKLNIASLVLFSMAQFLVGSRGTVLWLLFMIVLIVNSYYFKIRWKVLLPAVLLGLVFMVFLGITRLSSEYNLSSGDLMEGISYGIDFVMKSPSVLWMLLSDFVVNAKTLYEGIDYTRVNGFLFGTGYIQYLFVFLPMGGSFFTQLLTGMTMEEVSTGVILTNFSEATYGLGTNMVGDLYMNFSYFGVVVLMFLLGMFISWVEFPKSKYQMFAYLAIFADCIFLVRADIFVWLTFFVFFVIFDWIMRIHINYADIISNKRSS